MIHNLDAIDNSSPPAAKIALFRSLFRGRDDVYPRRFESRKTGRAGYAPACAHEWVSGICEKPRIKCADCPKRRFLPSPMRSCAGTCPVTMTRASRSSPACIRSCWTRRAPSSRSTSTRLDGRRTRSPSWVHVGVSIFQPRLNARAPAAAHTSGFSSRKLKPDPTNHNHGEPEGALAAASRLE